MYNGFFALCLTNLLFFFILTRENKLDVFKLYPLYVAGWLFYHYVFSDYAIDGNSIIMGILVGIGALSLYLFDRFMDKDIWIGIQPVVLILLMAMPVITSIITAALYFILTFWS